MLRREMLFGSAAARLLASRAQSQPQPVLSGYRETFSSRFNDPAEPLSIHNGGPFTTRFEMWGGLRTLPGTKELELYVDKAFVPSARGTDNMGRADAPPGTGTPLGYDPFSIKNGCLDITAVQASAAQRVRVDRPYLSGLVSTEYSFTQRFGYFEIRCQLPSGRGLWPAFWMVSKTWAKHVEIDIFEAIGDTGRVYHSASMYVPGQGTTTLLHMASPSRQGFDYSDGMHTYGLLWDEQELVYFIDGTETARTDATRLRDVPPMYMIACLAIGGNWAGAPPPETRFPATMRIEHIRAYQHL